jgi:AsmA family protein
LYGWQAARADGQATLGRATVKFSGVVDGLSDEPRIDGQLTARGPSLGLVAEPLGLTLPQTPPILLSLGVPPNGALRAFNVHRNSVLI